MIVVSDGCEGDDWEMGEVCDSELDPYINTVTSFDIQVPFILKNKLNKATFLSYLFRPLSYLVFTNRFRDLTLMYIEIVVESNFNNPYNL